ncbi:MAG: IS66 family insertion sequence element accessory protein TnpB [Clostridia bacterium]|nr:IS66 family insertion sequence element accessory protein TnpB [Clostridia bacterium]
MLTRMADGVEHIYLACGHTDFRKQIEGLSAMVSLKFRLEPCFSNSIFVFCNKKKNTIKLLRWDGNGYLLATKKLMEEMKFQWPKSPEEILDISQQEYKWLLEGLKIEQPKAHRKIKKKEMVY